MVFASEIIHHGRLFRVGKIGSVPPMPGEMERISSEIQAHHFRLEAMDREACRAEEEASRLREEIKAEERKLLAALAVLSARGSGCPLVPVDGC